MGAGAHACRDSRAMVAAGQGCWSGDVTSPSSKRLKSERLYIERAGSALAHSCSINARAVVMAARAASLVATLAIAAC